MSDIQKLYIDLDLKENLLVTVNCKQLDNLNLILNIWDNGIQADLNNYRCRLKALKQDQVPLIQNTDITINNNEVNIASDEQLTTTSGIVKTELQFMDKTTGEKKSTFNLNIKVIPSILEVDRTISVATITLLQELDNKLDEIEDIGDVLDEAKTVKTGLESDITNVKNIKENLDSSINTANATKTALDTSNTNSNNAKIALDASNASANNIKASLETTITNAENKRLDIVTECALADQKISAMQEFGDITVITQDVSNLKTEIQNARNGEVNLDERLDKVDASLSDVAHKTGTLQTNLNADMVDGLHSTSLFYVKGSTINNVDLNAITTQGIYKVNGSACTNTPTEADVSQHSILNVYNVSGVTVQELITTNNIAFGVYANAKYTRVALDGLTWSTWRQISTNDKPTEFNIIGLNGFIAISGSKSTYCKTQEGVVIIDCYLQKSAGQTGATSLFTLPAGYRPSIAVRAIANIGINRCCSVLIMPDGTTTFEDLDSSMFAIIKFTASFVAGN